jgi:hypothetical protein
MRTLFLTSVAWLLMAAMTLPTCQASTRLAHQYQVGETFTYELITDISTTATESGGAGGGKGKGKGKPPAEAQQVDENQIQVLTLLVAVDKVTAEGAAELKLTIRRVRSAMDTPTHGRVSYDTQQADTVIDSKNIPAQRNAENCRQMVGISWSLRLDRLGKITSVKPVPGKEGKPGPNGQPLLGADGMREICSQFFTPLPEAEVETGTEWVRKSASKTPYGSLRVTQTLSCDQIDAQGLCRLTTKDHFEPQVGPQIPLKVEMPDGAGEITFDVTRGRAVQGTSSQELSMRIELGEKKLDQKVRSKRTFRWVEQTGGEKDLELELAPSKPNPSKPNPSEQ